MFGLDRHYYYRKIKRIKKRQNLAEQVVELVRKIRVYQKRIGTRKLYYLLENELKSLKIGRDKFFDILRANHLLIKPKKNYHTTTMSFHRFRKHPNIIKELIVNRPNQVWVSDITYIKTDSGHAYLALVTDAYSRKIMGWSLQDNMKVSMVKDALNMAYKNCIFNNKNIIHHSDRGIQYCCPDYSQYAENKGFILSTTQQYDPYENAIAERINGILKYEFGLKATIKSIELAQKMVKEAVDLYNNQRMHWSLDLKKPQEVHIQYNKQENKNYKREKK